MNKRRKKKSDTATINHVKPLRLGKVGKFMQGECKIEQGKIIFVNRDQTIKTAWED